MLNRFYAKFFLLSITLLNATTVFGRTTLTRNDYYPLYTTMDPQAFLHIRTKDRFHGRDLDDEREKDCFSFYLTPFGQNANVGRDFDNHPYPDCSCNDCCTTEAEDPGESHLGSLNARWSMLGLLMGDIPEGQQYGDVLQKARKEIFGQRNGSDFITSPTQSFCDPTAIDCSKKFGFFQFPGCYKKRGMRFQISGAITDDIGLLFEGGFSSINLNICMSCCNDLTPDTIEDKCLQKAQDIYGQNEFTPENVKKYLTCRLPEIAHELGLNLCDFHKTSIEDFRIGGYWRHAYPINGLLRDYKCDDCCPLFLFIPFACLGFTIPSGKEACPLAPFSLPFGNNGHAAFWAYGGMNFDFTETIEVGWELGFTHFFSNNFSNYPMPTTNLQQGIYPFTTDVTIEPGMNWHFSLKMEARHFLDCLSFYFQWVIMEHNKDRFYAREDCCCIGPPACCGSCPGGDGYCNECSIKTGLCKSGGRAFKPEVLTCRSAWKAQVINTAFNYDISPNITLGFAWQAPISQRNVFRSSTAAFGINFTF